MNITEVSFAWEKEFTAPVLAILMLTVGFVTYWFLAESAKIQNLIREKWAHPNSSVIWVIYQKLSGVLFLGIIPLIVALAVFPYNLEEYGLSFKNTGASMLWIIALAMIIFPLNANAAKRPENLAYYPMMRVEEWSTKLVLINAAATISYLFSYELLFRGILLTACTASLGVWPAIAINIALYSTTHLPKGPAETIGAIPFGLLMCYITLSVGTIWVAVVIHVILSLSNDYLAVYYNPKMKFTR